jgi:hypothetical protein
MFQTTNIIQQEAVLSLVSIQPEIGIGKKKKKKKKKTYFLSKVKVRIFFFA